MLGIDKAEIYDIEFKQDELARWDSWQKKAEWIIEIEVWFQAIIVGLCYKPLVD